jgi:hypothetical protein
LIGTGTAMNGLKILGIAAIMFAVVPGSALPQTSEQPDPRIADLVQAGKLRNSGWHQDMGGCEASRSAATCGRCMSCLADVMCYCRLIQRHRSAKSGW